MSVDGIVSGYAWQWLPVYVCDIIFVWSMIYRCVNVVVCFRVCVITSVAAFAHVHVHARVRVSSCLFSDSVCVRSSSQESVFKFLIFDSTIIYWNPFYQIVSTWAKKVTDIISFYIYKKINHAYFIFNDYIAIIFFERNIHWKHAADICVLRSRILGIFFLKWPHDIVTRFFFYFEERIMKSKY